MCQPDERMIACEIEWEKYGNSVKLKTKVGSRIFTVDELEEGLRIAKEKPVFIGVNSNNVTVEYHKKSSGRVYYRIPSGDNSWKLVTESEMNACESARKS